jgi:hypothetical protein
VQRIAIMLSAVVVLLAACSGDAGTRVASLEGGPVDTVTVDEDATDTRSDEDAILDFAACMRDNGLEDFEDPEIDADGGIAFGFRGLVEDGEVDRDTVRAAMQTCRIHLEGLSFAASDLDRTEIEDQMFEFAACMRDNGIDMEDPEFSGTPGQGGPGSGPFAELDPDDPEFQAALEACGDIFEGGFPAGPGAGRGGGG